MNQNNLAWISHRWQRDTRYYEVHLKQDLFGWVLIQNWGGIENRSGQQKTNPVAGYQDGLVKMEQIFKKRKQRRYQLCHY